VLEVEGVSVAFDGHRVLDDLHLTVAPGEIVCVAGPSGCGKSTLLRVIAGLQPVDAGRVWWDGEDITARAPHERRVGLIFQDFQLFPHRDVAGNIAFGLRMQRRPKAEIARRTSELLEMVGLAGYGHRRVATLSGGEQQRVALARSLAPEPRLLLLDEPLGALDRDLHDRLTGELRVLLKELGTTAVHVTHDRDEAAAIGDRVVELTGGRIEAQ
jgi:thiamine transport system ATP-binding protein